MASRVRHLSSATVVRLREEVFRPVQRLARLAGVSVADLVEIVLLEALRDDAVEATDWHAGAPGRPTCAAERSAQPRGPARVIPLAPAGRQGCSRPKERPSKSELMQLRQVAAAVCIRAHAARRRSESACRAAAAARTAAAQALALVGR